MNRRDALKALAGVAVAPAVLAAMPEVSPKPTLSVWLKARMDPRLSSDRIDGGYYVPREFADTLHTNTAALDRLKEVFG